MGQRNTLSAPRCGTRRPALRQRHGSSSHPGPPPGLPPAPFPPAWKRKDFGQMGHAEHAFRAPPPCGTRRPAFAPAARLFEPRDMRPCGLPAHSLGSGLVRPVRRILSLSGPAAALFPPALKRPRSKECPRARKARQGVSALPPQGRERKGPPPPGGTAPRTCRSLRHGPPRRNGTSSPAEHRPGVIPPPKRRGMAQACRLPWAFRRPPHRARPGPAPAGTQASPCGLAFLRIPPPPFPPARNGSRPCSRSVPSRALGTNPAPHGLPSPRSASPARAVPRAPLPALSREERRLRPAPSPTGKGLPAPSSTG